jgi:hypothetical protein
MATSVKARFFKVSNAENAKPFVECLNELSAQCQAQPWIEVAKDLHFHISRLETDGDFISGEFVRRQITDIPPQAPDDAVLVPQNTPIGHRCAFRYMVSRDIILMEVRKSSISPNHLKGVLHRLFGIKGTLILPVLRDHAWKRLSDRSAAKFIVRVAHPENLEPMDEPDDITRSLLTLRNALQAPQIEIHASFPPYEEGWLPMDRIKRISMDLLRQSSSGSVKKVQVKLDNETDILDLLEDHAKVAGELELDDMDVDRHYESRKEFLRTSFEEFTSGQAADDCDT